MALSCQLLVGMRRAALAVLAISSLSFGAMPAMGQAPDKAPPDMPNPPKPSAADLMKPGTPSGPQGDSWTSIAQLPDLTTGLWQGLLVGGFTKRGGAVQYDVVLPLTPAWQPLFKKVHDLANSGGDVPGRAKQCVPRGFTGNMLGPGDIFQILYTPGQVVIVSQAGALRRIYTNGRKHPADPDASFQGDSVGFWNSRILSVDTIGLDPGNEFLYGIPGGKDMHVYEHIYLATPNYMIEESALVAPQAMTQPYVRRSTLPRKADWEMLESFCDPRKDRSVGADGSQKFDLTPPPK